MPIESSESDHGILINVSGSLDRSASTELEDVVNTASESRKPIVVNLYDVSYISSVSIGTLIKLHNTLSGQKVPICVSNASDECRKIFEMVELDKVMPVYDDDDQAFKELNS